MTSTDQTRRTFIKTGSAALAALPSIGRAANANSQIQHACVGVGGMMGYNDFKNFSSHAKTKVVAICDVDRNYLDRVAKEVPEARTYTDWCVPHRLAGRARTATPTTMRIGAPV